jgi:Na+-driven multidrug efflux pump
MIFGLFGFPKMGVAGAAIATVIGQFVGASVGLYLCLTKNHEIKLRFKGFRPDGAIIKRIYSVGVPSVLMGSLGSVMTYGVNRILIVFSSTATAVFGVYFRLQSFVFMPVFGLNNGMVPILAYNYGARKKERILKTIKLSLISAVSIMLLGVVIFQLLPERLLMMFNATDDMLEIGVRALRTISISFLFAGFSIIFISVFQALGDGMKSLFANIGRQLIVLLPAAWLLSLSGSVNAIWWAFPLAELVTVTLCLIFFRGVYKNKIAKCVEHLD